MPEPEHVLTVILGHVGVARERAFRPQAPPSRPDRAAGALAWR